MYNIRYAPQTPTTLKNTDFTSVGTGVDSVCCVLHAAASAAAAGTDSTEELIHREQPRSKRFRLPGEGEQRQLLQRQNGSYHVSGADALTPPLHLLIAISVSAHSRVMLFTCQKHTYTDHECV